MLVEKVLNFTRVRRTIKRLDPPSLEIGDGVRRAADALAHLSAERNVHVVIAVPEGTRARIDAEELHQVMLNVLENAIKYGPVGQTITIGASADDKLTRVWVEDQGPGVPHAERNAIWDAFHRGRHAERSAEAGSGIGLAIVREIAVQYGGRAFVESRPPDGRSGTGGARFVVELPVAVGV
jgi:signal transduction histidine kinase